MYILFNYNLSWLIFNYIKIIEYKSIILILCKIKNMLFSKKKSEKIVLKEKFNEQTLKRNVS